MITIQPFDDSAWKQRIQDYRQTLSRQQTRLREYDYNPVPVSVPHGQEKFHEHVYVTKHKTPDKPLPHATIVDFSKEKTRQTNWQDLPDSILRWNNILRYLDDDNLFYPDGRLRKRGVIMRVGAGVFKAGWNNRNVASYALDIDMSLSPTFGRDVERDAFLSMLENALTHFASKPLTHSQQETAMLDQMAKRSNVPAIALISNVLSISVNVAKKRLASTRAKMGTFSDDYDMIEIKQALETTPRYCPFCAEQGRQTIIPVSTYAMCWQHHERFNLFKDFGRYPVKEYEKVIQVSTRDYWQSVRNTIDENRMLQSGKIIVLPTVTEQKQDAA